MSAHTVARLAWSLASLWAALFIASVVLTFLSETAGAVRYSDIVGEALVFVPFTAFPIVGALIASRRPRNPIGWICLADGLLWMLIGLSEDYSAYGIVRPGSVPFPVTINALLYAWMWVPAVGLLGTFLLLLFPDGRLPSRRWRPLAWLSGTVMLFVSVLTFVIPGPLEGLGGRAIRSGSKDSRGLSLRVGSCSRSYPCACSPRRRAWSSASGVQSVRYASRSNGSPLPRRSWGW